MLQSRTHFYSLFLVFFTWATSLLGSEIWIVGSKLSKVDTISRELLEKAYLNKPYQNADSVTPIDRSETNTELRTRFYTHVVNKSNTQLKAYWSAAVFTGKAYPPRAAQDMAEIKKILSSDFYTVTFIDPTELESWMKVLLKIPITP